MNHHLFSLLLLHIRNITVFCNAYLPTLATAYFIFADFITFGLHSKCDSVCFAFMNYICNCSKPPQVRRQLLCKTENRKIFFCSDLLLFCG
jgi:hypothetical protein